MASEKVVKVAIVVAMVAVVLGVLGYVAVFYHNYRGCQQLEADALAQGKPMSCAEIKEEAKARATR